MTNLRPDDPRADQDDRDVVAPILAHLYDLMSELLCGRQVVNSAAMQAAMDEAFDAIMALLNDTNNCGLDIVNARIDAALAAEDEADTEGLKRAHEAGVR